MSMCFMPNRNGFHSWSFVLATSVILLGVRGLRRQFADLLEVELDELYNENSSDYDVPPAAISSSARLAAAVPRQAAAADLPGIEVLLGVAHVKLAIRTQLQPILQNYFSTFRKDIPVPRTPLVLHNLQIESFQMSDPAVKGGSILTPDPARGLVAGFTLSADTQVVATLILGHKGVSGETLVRANLDDRVEVSLEVMKGTTYPFISITRLELLKVRELRPEDLTITGSQELNARRLRKMINLENAVVNGINSWGEKPEGLEVPLQALLGIHHALLPSGPCLLRKNAYRVFGQSQEMCRARINLDIRVLDVWPDMTMRAVLGFDPYVESTILGSTDPRKKGQVQYEDWYGPAYRGTPMPYTTDDSRNDAMNSYKEALDACVADAECQSVYVKRKSNSPGDEDDVRVEYFMGQTMFPVDLTAGWEPCAIEGRRCHYSDKKRNRTEYVWAKNGNVADKRRLMMVRFVTTGASGKQYVKTRTVHDDGDGIPCTEYFFRLGRQDREDEAQTARKKKGKCFRLTTTTATQDNAIVANPTCPSPGDTDCKCEQMYCPLERPCAMRNIPFKSKKILRNSNYCLPQTIANGSAECFSAGSSIADSDDCWNMNLPFTQPVYKAARRSKHCFGRDHLSCWASLRPSSLANMQLDSVGPDSVMIGLPLDVVNAALALVYETGILSTKMYSLGGAGVKTIDDLCQMPGWGHYFCIDTDGNGTTLHPQTPLKIHVQQTMPGRVAVDDRGHWHMSWGLQVSVLGAPSEHTRRSPQLSIPLEQRLPDGKVCHRKEGVLDVTRNGKKGPVTTPQWVELVGHTLQVFSVIGRKQEAEFDVSSKWIAVASEPLPCFYLSSVKKPPEIWTFCSDASVTNNEWLSEIKASRQDSCDNSELQTGELARWKFSMKTMAGLRVVDGRYVCLSPHIPLKNNTYNTGGQFLDVGTLQTRSGNYFANGVTRTGTASLILRFLVNRFNILRPIQIWNLESLVDGAGLERDPSPIIQSNQEGIVIKGKLVHGRPSGGDHFDLSETNPCAPPPQAEQSTLGIKASDVSRVVGGMINRMSESNIVKRVLDPSMGV